MEKFGNVYLNTSEIVAVHVAYKTGAVETASGLANFGETNELDHCNIFFHGGGTIAVYDNGARELLEWLSNDTPEEQPTEDTTVIQWYNDPEGLWPSKINDIRVAYVKVLNSTPLRNSVLQKVVNGVRTQIFAISSVKNLRPGKTGLASRRMIAQEGSILCVNADGNQYHTTDKEVRPFVANEGVDCFMVMYENKSFDGIFIEDHPDKPLYIPANKVEIFYKP